MPTFRTQPGAWLRRAVAAVVVLVLWGLLTHGTHAGSGDEPHYQMIAHSLAFDGDLDVANNYADRTNLIAGGTLIPEAHAIAGKDGRLRPVHDIGLPLIFAPYFAAAYVAAEQAGSSLPPALLERAKLTEGLILRHLLSLAMIGITAWIAVQLFDIGLGLGASRSLAAGCALLLTLSPPLLSHSFLFFTEILSAGIALWLFRWVTTPNFGRRSPVLIGALTGLLLLIHARNAGLVAGLTALAVVMMWRPARPSRALPLFLLGLAAALVVRTAITWHLWGTLITTPHAHLGAAGAGAVSSAAETFRRLFGWLFDQEHGLFFYAPIYLLVPAGCLALWRRDRTLSVQLAVVAGLYIVVMAMPFINPHGWRGGWSPAARFLVPIVPLLAYPIFAWAISVRRSLLFAVLIAVQVALNALLWQYPKLLWNLGDGTSELLMHLGGGTDRLVWLFPSDARVLAPMLVAALIVIALAWMPVRRLRDADHG
ncbi:MAG: hypothetical protein WD690_01790 [Vicinamibacterales bacterium]